MNISISIGLNDDATREEIFSAITEGSRLVGLSIIMAGVPEIDEQRELSADSVPTIVSLLLFRPE